MARGAELIREYVDAWNRRDEDAVVGAAAEDVVVRSALLAASEGDGIYRGRDGVRQWYREIVSTMDLRFDVRDTLELGDLVLAITGVETRGAASGVALGGEMGVVFRFRGSQFRLALGHRDPIEAIEEFARLAREAAAGR